MTAEEVIRHLGLHPHPRENGFFTETYRSDESVAWSALPGRYQGSRNFSTSIYFLLRAGSFSEMHRLQTDEIFHFHLAAPAELLLLSPDGSRLSRLGTNLAAGEFPQVVVPRGCWQGMRSTGEFTLLGCTVAPGFEYSDCESGKRQELIHQYPEFNDLILQLTHE